MGLNYPYIHSTVGRESVMHVILYPEIMWLIQKKTRKGAGNQRGGGRFFVHIKVFHF